jgi:hypothetical protein
MTRVRELFRSVSPRARVFLAATFVVLAVTASQGGSFCPFALLTGIPCPGCGLGRATLALLSGDPRQAFHFHPLVFVALPALGGFGWLAFSSVRNERVVTALAGALLVATVGVWIARFEGAFGGPVSVRSARSLLADATR